MKNLKYTLIVLLFFTISCEKNESEWIDLFDGKSTDGWRAYNGKEIPQKWAAVDGELTFDTDLKLENEWKGGGDIIYYKEEFEYFELYLEWKLPKGGNSGVFYNVQEGFQAPYAISPEYQLIDDLGWEEINNAKLEEWQKAGANYAMHEADLSKKQLNPAGQWNSSRILYTAKKVQHWLNGELLLEFEPYSKEWLLKRDSGKWDDYPDYGKFRKGYIALQDHDSPIFASGLSFKLLSYLVK